MTATVSQEFDADRAGAFAGIVIDALNKTGLIYLTSIAHNLALFDVMAQFDSFSSADLASASSLAERPIRELLGGLAIAGTLEYEPTSKTYRLPPEHAAFLTSSAGANNLAAVTKIVPLFASIESAVIESFRTGKGVSYAEFPAFQAVQAELTGPFIDESLVSTVLPLVDGVIEKLSSGISVLEIGCGQGHATNVLAKAFPSSRFTGYDFADDAIAAARAEADQLGLTNVTFSNTDLASVDQPSAFDFAFCMEVIHDLADPVGVSRNIWNALKPGASLLAIEPAASSVLEENMGHPLGVFFFTASLYHCMSVSLAQDGEGLGTMAGDGVLSDVFRQAGFGPVEVKHIEGDFMYSYLIGSRT